MARIEWYFEDFEPGRAIEVGSRTLNEEEILAFDSQFDPQALPRGPGCRVAVDLRRHHRQRLAYLRTDKGMDMFLKRPAEG